MPKERNIDREREEGAIVYTIGGKRFLAEEPDLDTVKAVLEMSPEDTGDESRESSIEALDSIVPQLEVLLVPQEELDSVPDEELEKDRAKPVKAQKYEGGDSPTARFRYHMHANLSAKRAGSILEEVLGEDESGRP